MPHVQPLSLLTPVRVAHRRRPPAGRMPAAGHARCSARHRRRRPEVRRDGRRPARRPCRRADHRAVDRAGRARGLRRADQAADHRAAAAHHRAGDVPRRAAASRRSGWSSPPCVGGTLAAGSANALNCVYDRDIDEQMRRTRRRPLPRHMVTPARGAGLRAGARRASRRCWLGLLVNWLLGRRWRWRANAFYVVVYTMVLKRRTTAEHRLGRRRRLLPGADRLDRGHRLAGLGAGRAVPAWSSSGRRRTTGRWRCATARTTPRAGVPMLPVVAPARDGRPADRRLHLGDGRDLAAAVAGRRHRLVLPGRRRSCSARRSWSRRTCCCGAAARAPTTSWRCKPMRLFHCSNMYLSLLFVAVALDPLLMR